MPDSNDKHDLDIGDGHWIDWIEYDSKRRGGIITHTTSKTETGLCSGSFWIKGLFNEEKFGGNPRPTWEFNGSFDAPTLSPSFLCHCGDHGFIRDGKWVRT